MNEAEKRLADALMAAGYSLSEITGILIAVGGFIIQENHAETSARMGSLAHAALVPFAQPV